MARLLPGALGHVDSAKQDSFVDDLLDCPHYTRPEIVYDKKVPEVLLSGDHQAIDDWRLQQRLGRTWLRRPDLLKMKKLTSAEEKLLASFIDAL
jgi:tRNA (guanine37-N1)-methyltransferase